MNINYKFILSVILIVISISCVIRIVFDKRDPKGTLAWILIFILSQPIGIILYILIGQNWRNRKMKNKSHFFKEKIFKKYSSRKPNNSDYNFIQNLVIKNDFNPILSNNSVNIFNNGKDKFDALKKELLKSNHHIHIEYYIVRNDKIGNEIKDILIKKSNEGIKVRFIIDKIGSLGLGKKYINDLKTAGVDVSFYSYIFAPFYRNHKKIVIIDGKVGFLGGMNIGDEYEGKGKLGYWRDLHIMVTGDFVLSLQNVFLYDYYMINKKSNKSIPVKDEFMLYFPEIKNDNHLPMQLVESGPSSENPSIMQAMVKMISSAKDHIYIMTPYFIPSESLLTSLKIAALSGIDVRILFPEKYDHFYVYYASRTYLLELAKCGAKIYLYRNDSFLHSKAITVDGEICTLGNTNIDIRSFELNYEANAIIYDSNTTKNLEELFYKDLSESKLVSGEYFENSSNFVKLLENTTRIFSNSL